ncbi:hypothetical protein [Brevifollis gellanilyticus]|uniref:hypothetical protein n=1 Tax=Brevifollis gellanilyticus TaxID=748831 RepID=UPI001478BB08|nr:hypothetical protein [Brevifollis gellanilyticus]
MKSTWPSSVRTSSIVAILAILLWMGTGFYTLLAVFEYGVPMARESTIPELGALEFAVGWTAWMTCTCRLLQYCLYIRTRWSFTLLMAGQLGLGPGILVLVVLIDLCFG